MELSFKELSKRDVINVVDGKSLGKIKDLRLSFPRGILTGIVVPGRSSNIFLKIFEKNSVFIPEKNIIKIGGDVILVNLNCGDSCDTSVNLRPKKQQCPPPCPPQNCGFNNGRPNKAPSQNGFNLPNPNELNMGGDGDYDFE